MTEQQSIKEMEAIGFKWEDIVPPAAAFYDLSKIGSMNRFLVVALVLWGCQLMPRTGIALEEQQVKAYSQH